MTDKEKEEIIISPDTNRSQRIPPGQRQVSNFPVLQFSSVPDVDPAKWSFHIFGMVQNEVKLNLTQFQALPAVNVFSDIHCVTGWSRLDNNWEGPATGIIRKLTTILPEARFVVIHCAQGFTTNLTIEDFFSEDALFALKHDGEPISTEHGAPVRLVVPQLYFWKSAKWVQGIEFTAEDSPGFWESYGYHNHGDPWLEERYSA